MKILFTICGRAGSKGIKNKNIRNFLDNPLPLYTISAIDLCLKQMPDVDYEIAVNTDSEELKEICEKNELRKITCLKRKEELAGDKVGKVAVIEDTLRRLEENGGRFVMVIDLDLTSPLRKKNDLLNVIHEKSNHDFDVVFTCTDSRRNPYFNMVKKNKDGFFELVISSDYTARQQAPELFDMNASIYAYSPSFLKEKKTIFEGKCGMVKMQDTGILDLDHENDFTLMEVIAKWLYENNKEYNAIYENINSGD